MPALQVRDVPPRTYESLVEYAAKQHRSIAQQTLAIIEEYLAAHAFADAIDPTAKDLPHAANDAGAIPHSAEQTSLAPRASFVPFQANGITYLTPPNATPDQRRKRMLDLLDGIDEMPGRDIFDTLPPAVEVVRQMREERLGQLGSTVKGRS